MEKHHHHQHTDHKHDHADSHEHEDHLGYHEHEHEHPAYTHTHEHSHDHSHNHCDNKHTQEYDSEDLRKLSILLDHWVGHNEDHAREFEQWADKAKGLGKNEVAEAIMEAVSLVKSATESLKAAKEKL